MKEIYFDFKQGGIINSSNNGISLVNFTKLVKASKGYAHDRGSQLRFILPNSLGFSSSQITLEYELYIQRPDTYIGGLRKDNTNHNIIAFMFTGFGSGLGFRVSDSTGASLYTKVLSKLGTGNYRLVISIKNNIVKIGVNGTITTFTDFSNPNFVYNTGTSGILLGDVGGGNTPRFLIYKFRISDEFLSDKQILERYVLFNNSKPLNKPTIFQPNLSVLKPTEIRETGLIAAYNFRPVNGKLPNIAWDNPANGYNARLLDGSGRFATTPEGIKVAKFSNVLFAGNTPNMTLYTICCTYKHSGSESYIAQNGGTVFIGYPNGTTAFGFNDGITNTTLWILPTGSNSFINTYIIRVSTLSVELFFNGVSQGKKVLSSNPNVTIRNIKRVNDNGFDGPFLDYRIYNRPLLDQEIKNYHNQFASKIVLQEDFSQYPVGATRFGNWKPINGNIKISENKSFKYLSCTSLSSIKYPSVTAYGTWSFKLMSSFPGGGYDLMVALISNSSKSIFATGTYYIIVYGSGGNRYKLALAKDSGTSVILGPIFTANILHDIKITRDTSGLFKLYLDNILIGSAIDNTYTTSKYIGANLQNDILTDIKITQGITV